MRKRDGATTPSLNPSGNEWKALEYKTRERPQEALLVASLVCAATVAGDLSPRLLEIYDQHVAPPPSEPAAGHIPRNAVIGKECFAGYDMGGLVVSDPPDGVGVRRVGGRFPDADPLLLTVVQKHDITRRLQSFIGSYIK